jgi:hypothetical protein
MWWRSYKSVCPLVASTERTDMKFGSPWCTHTKICLENLILTYIVPM